jgi:hypothetical protein
MDDTEFNCFRVDACCESVSEQDLLTSIYNAHDTCCQLWGSYYVKRYNRVEVVRYLMSAIALTVFAECDEVNKEFAACLAPLCDRHIPAT